MPSEQSGFLRDDPPAGGNLGALMVAGITGGGGGGGDASAANQVTEIARLTSIRDRLPAALDPDGGLPVHVVNIAGPFTVTGTVGISGSVAVTGPLTDTQLRATPVPVSGTVSTGGLTDTQLRASAVPVSVPGSVAVTGTFFQATQPVSLATNTPDVTDRAARLLGHVTVDNASIPVTGPLTDTQLRASAVPVSGTVTASGPLTDTQLRASAVAVQDPANTVTTGTISALNGTVGLAVPNGATTWTAVMTGTITGTTVLTFEGSPDGGTTYYSIPAAARSSVTPAPFLTLSAAQISIVPVVMGDATGWTHIRVRASTYQASDSINIRLIFDPTGSLAIPITTVTVDSELPAAAALADAAGNPTVPTVGAFGSVFNGSTWDRARGNTVIGTQVGQVPASLAVSATAAVSTGVTATLPAIAGQFHYITRIEIVQVSSTTAGAAGAPLTVTTTNLPGSLTFTRPTLVAGGGEAQLIVAPNSPLKSSTVNTATTIVAPVHTNIIWRINVFYYGAP